MPGGDAFAALEAELQQNKATAAAAGPTDGDGGGDDGPVGVEVSTREDVIGENSEDAMAARASESGAPTTGPTIPAHLWICKKCDCTNLKIEACCRLCGASKP